MSTEVSLRTFGDIYNAIREALGIQAADTNAVNKIKRQVNIYYLNEVVSFKRWSWLQKSLQTVHGAYYNVDTVSVTPASTAITFTTAPNISVGSFVGYKFSVDNSNKVYQIASHTAGSANATITSAYQENVNATARYKVWRDRIDLPTNAKETVQITHAEQTSPLTALGPQAFGKYETSSPKREGFPSWYNTDTFFNPSDVEGEDDRYRQVRLFPSITTTPVTLNIDYIEEAVALIEDTDEPIVPLEDRSVLYYGAGALSYSLLQRNEEMAAIWQAKADRKLARMAGDRDDGFDSPKISPNGSYVNSQRNRGRGLRARYSAGFTGQTSVAIPSYLKDVIINGGTLTANLNVSAGVLIGGVDISALALSENLTTVALLDNTANQVVATFALATYNMIHLEYGITRGSTAEAGKVTLTGTNASSSIAQGGIASVGDTGVTFSTDVSGSSIRLLATTTATGTAPSVTYKVRPWLG